MIEIKVKPKRWGNSTAIILPEAVVKKARIKAGKPIDLLIPEKVRLADMWGKLHTKKSAKELKEKASEGWK